MPPPQERSSRVSSAQHALGAPYINRAHLRGLYISLYLQKTYTHVCYFRRRRAGGGGGRRRRRRGGQPPQSRTALGRAHRAAAGARGLRPGAIGGAAPPLPRPGASSPPPAAPPTPSPSGGGGAGRPVCSGSAEPAHSAHGRARRPRGEERRRRAGPGAARRGSAERPCAGAAEAGSPCAVPRAGLAILRRSGGTRLGFPPVMSPGQQGKATHSRAAAEA